MYLWWYFKNCSFFINQNAEHKKGSQVVSMIQRQNLCNNSLLGGLFLCVNDQILEFKSLNKANI